MDNQTKTYEELEIENTSLAAKNADLTEENAELKQRIAALEKAVFGPKSEKTKAEEITEQIQFDEAEENQSVNELEDEKQTVVTGYSRKKKRTRDEIFANLPAEEVVHSVEEKACPECGTEMRVIGKEYVREELVYIPPSAFRSNRKMSGMRYGYRTGYSQRNINKIRHRKSNGTEFCFAEKLCVGRIAGTYIL